MKRNILLIFMLVVCHCVFGYDGNRKPQYELGKNEVSVSYGLLPIFDLVDGIDHHIHIQDSDRELSSVMKTHTGAINVEYTYGLAPRFRLGLMASYMGYRHDVDYEHDYIGELKSTYIGLLPMVQLYWFSHDHVAMYSKFAVGAALNMRDMNSINEDLYASFDDTNAQFEMQISPICFEAGGRIRGFAELGFGNYLFSAGMKYYW